MFQVPFLPLGCSRIPSARVFPNSFRSGAPEFLPSGCSRIPSAWMLPNSFRLGAPEFLPLQCSRIPSAWVFPNAFRLGVRSLFAHATGMQRMFATKQAFLQQRGRRQQLTTPCPMATFQSPMLLSLEVFLGEPGSRQELLLQARCKP